MVELATSPSSKTAVKGESVGAMFSLFLTINYNTEELKKIMN